MSNCSVGMLMMSKPIWSSMGVHSCEWFFARDIVGFVLWIGSIAGLACNIRGTSPDSKGSGGGLLVICIALIVMLYGLAIIWDFVLVLMAGIGICCLFCPDRAVDDGPSALLVRFKGLLSRHADDPV